MAPPANGRGAFFAQRIKDRKTMATVAKRQWTYKGKTKTAWVVRYTDQTGKERLKTFQSRAEAQNARLDIENEIELGIHTAARASLIIRDLAQKYLKHVNSLREAETIGDSYYRGIELALRRSIVPKLGDIK